MDKYANKTSRKVKNSAIYLDSEVLSLRETDLILKVIETYGFAFVLMDRNSNPLEESTRYSLSYDERSEIVKREMTENGIVEYAIVPMDVSFQQAILENEIRVVVMDFEREAEDGFRRMRKVEFPCNVETVLMSLGNGNRILNARDLARLDSSAPLQRGLFSDRAFFRYKFGNTLRVELVGNGERMDILEDVITERKYGILDMDIAGNEDLRDGIVKNVRPIMFFKTSGNGGKFKKTIGQCRIFVEGGNDVLEMSKYERTKGDFVLSGKNETEFRNRAIELVNNGLRKLLRSK